MNLSGELTLFGAILLLSLVALFWGLWLLKRKHHLSPRFSFVEIPSGFKIHYQDVGSGPPVLFIHGIGASSFCWRRLVPILSPKYRMILLDLPGFGQSDKLPNADYGLEAQCQRLAEFLDKLGHTKVFIVGSSMGGTLALWLGRQQPERCFRIVAIAPATDPGLVPFRFKSLAGVSPLLGLTARRWLIHQALKRVVLHHRDFSPDEIDQYWAPYNRSPVAVRTFLLATQSISDPRLPNELRDLSIPTLILWGQKDRMVPLKSIQKLECVLPKAALLSHPEAGHHTQEDQPKWTAQQIDQFFQSSV